MYFKRIEMHGFKSFAEPVVIEFHKGITCVVGPNGSGKSNISDAIRWVLGEQSPKMLRGGKMEEVIFSGTASRKSRGMAEVTLVIDNAEGELPIDYNEVAITRRMFRSGESEYSINNNPCRLRDIRELIMDTGIGVDGYSLIGQGKISDIISNKTESRREIFEEAAGIVMYRTKKAEAERKLSSASANLERVNDIIGEIEGRIDGLREDSEKAREYIELRDRNKELEINITLKNIENLEEKQQGLTRDLREQQAKLEETRGKKDDLDKRLAETQSKSASLQAMLDESREKLMQGNEEINGLISKEKINEERLKAIAGSRQRLKQEAAALREKLQKENANADEVRKTSSQAKQELEEIKKAIQEKTEQHLSAARQMESAAQEADRCKDEIFQAHSSISAQKGEMLSLENLKETLQSRERQVIAEKNSNEDSNRETLDMLGRLRSEKKEKEEQLKQTKKSLEQKREAAAGKAREERGLSSQVESLRIESSRLSARKKTIEEMEHNYEGYNYAVRFIMKAGISGILGTVAELIEVPRGFETAIETALGAALQNIVCTDDKSAQNAIARLKQQKAGRLTFLPVSSIRGGRGRGEEILRSEEGFRGLGTDCVTFDEKYRNVLEYLLGRVAVIDTMEHAVRLSKKAAGFRFVTLEGEIINAGGAITGGRYKNKTANLLERKAEIGDLEQKLREMEREKSESSRRLESLRLEIQEGETAERLLNEDQRKLEMELSGMESELTALENSLNNLKAHGGKWEKELETIRSERESAGSMIAELEKKIRKLEETAAEKERQAGRMLDDYEKKKAEAEKINQEITTFRIEAGACESKKAGADEMAERIRILIRDLEFDLQDREKQARHLETEKEELETGHTDIAAAVKEKQETVSNLQEYLDQLAEEKDSAGKQAETLAFEKESLERQLASFQDQKYEMEIKAAKNETQLDTYKEKLWEDFEISYIQAMEFKKQDFVMSSAVKENRSIKNRMKELGEVNIGAIAEYETVSERYEFLTGQRQDILEAAGSLNRIIADMDKTIRQRFKESFDQTVFHFEKVFTELFGGGHAELRLEDETNPLESEISITAQPPGKKLQNINLLSGGEKTMTAIALMFAVLRTKPTPFCILDEVEAALDDANIERFAKYLKTFEKIQFTLVTHQKTTMEYADVLYGVTMPEQGISRVLSLNLAETAQG